MNYREALELVKAYDGNLTVDDPRFKSHCLIHHNDGSVLSFSRSFICEEDGWVFVFTEHHGYRVYHSEDLVAYYASTKVGSL